QPQEQRAGRLGHVAGQPLHPGRVGAGHVMGDEPDQQAGAETDSHLPVQRHLAFGRGCAGVGFGHGSAAPLDNRASLTNPNRPFGPSGQPPQDEQAPAQSGGYRGGSGPVSRGGASCQRGPRANASRSCARAATPSPPAQRARSIASTASRWAGSASRSSTCATSRAGGRASPRSRSATSAKSPVSSAWRSAFRSGRVEVGGCAGVGVAAVDRAAGDRCTAQTRVNNHSAANTSAASTQARCSRRLARAVESGVPVAATGSPPDATGADEGGTVDAGALPDTSQSSAGSRVVRALPALTSHHSMPNPALVKAPPRAGTSENRRG